MWRKKVAVRISILLRWRPVFETQVVRAVWIVGQAFVVARHKTNPAVTKVRFGVIEASVADLCGNTSRKRCAASAVREERVHWRVMFEVADVWIAWCHRIDHARYGIASGKLSEVRCRVTSNGVVSASRGGQRAFIVDPCTCRDPRLHDCCGSLLFSSS